MRVKVKKKMNKVWSYVHVITTITMKKVFHIRQLGRVSKSPVWLVSYFNSIIKYNYVSKKYAQNVTNIKQSKETFSNSSRCTLWNESFLSERMGWSIWCDMKQLKTRKSWNLFCIWEETSIWQNLIHIYFNLRRNEI